MKYELKPYHRHISEQELLDDLKKVATELDSDRITKEQYLSKGKFSSKTYESRFGTWNKALEKAELSVSQQKNLSYRELFDNIEQVWINLGRQPLYSEIKRPLSKYSTRPYDLRFGSWRKALEAFIGYINSDNSSKEELQSSTFVEFDSDKNKQQEIIHHKTKRHISNRLKVQVLIVYGNKCNLCGTLVTGDNIHFDHIKPWSKGGETVLENLQVLCEEHNLAKGDWEYEKA
jgi:predicted Zn-ribbon and HTH transcriptional regulator